MGTIIFGILLSITIILLFISRKIKQMKINQLYLQKTAGNFEKCFLIMESLSCKIVFSSYEYLLLRLTLALEAGSEKEVTLCHQKLKQAFIKKEQKEQLLLMIFLYYIEQNQAESAAEVLESMEKIESTAVLAEAKKNYHIFIEKDGQYIQQMENDLENITDMEKRRELFSLLCLQYQNIGDSVKENYYLELLQEGA